MLFAIEKLKWFEGAYGCAGIKSDQADCIIQFLENHQ
jgi:hypothetical protein